MGLFDIFGSGDQQQAAQDQQRYLAQGYGQFSDLANQGRGALTQNYTAGLQPFQQNYATGQAGLTSLGNALGLNGDAGNQAAIQAFQNNPGYQFQLQQGNNAINAANAASGNTGSGNALIDLAKYNQGLAGTSWNNYVNQLQPYMGLANSSASGIGSLYGQLGNNLNQSFTNQGNAAYGTAVGQGNAQASADLAPLSASANLWGALGNGLRLGTQLFGAFA